MLARKPVTHFTVEEYLALEAVALEKHEYWDGELFAMAGARPHHNAVASNAIAGLQFALRDRPCLAVGSDQRFAVVSGGRYVYPDGIVACAPIAYDAHDPSSIANPSVVIEVLSPSTEDYDRGPKLDAYRQIPSVTDVLLIDVDARSIEHWFRSGGGWDRVIRTEGAVPLALGVELPSARFWEKLDLLG